MTTTTVKSLDELARAIKKDVKNIDKKIDKAFKKTIKQSVPLIKKNANFGKGNIESAKVRGNIKVIMEELKIICERPYSLFSEIGTPPVKLNVQPLLDWCQEKGIDEKIAYKIAKRIEKSGVTPHMFMQKALPQIKELLTKNIKGEGKGSPVPDASVDGGNK